MSIGREENKTTATTEDFLPENMKRSQTDVLGESVLVSGLVNNVSSIQCYIIYMNKSATLLLRYTV